MLATFGRTSPPLVLVAAGVGPPIPEELPVVAGGAWAALDSVVRDYGPYRWLMLPVCILGVVISDGLLYGIGRKFGTRLLDMKFFKKIVPPAKRGRDRGELPQARYQGAVSRFLPGIRSPIFIMAGVMKLPLKRFILADGIYAIPGVSLLFFLAWWFGDTFIALIEAFEKGVSHNYVKPLLILIALVGVIVFLVYKFLATRQHWRPGRCKSGRATHARCRASSR